MLLQEKHFKNVFSISFGVFNTIIFRVIENSKEAEFFVHFENIF